MLRENEFNRVRRSATEIIKTPLVLTRALQVPGVSELPSVRARSDPLDWLKKEVQVDWPGNSALMRVRMRRRTEDEAVIVDAVADSIVQLFGADEMRLRLGRFYEITSVAERYRELVRSERGRYQRHAKRLGAQSDIPVSIEIQSVERDLKTIDAMIAATSNQRRWTVPLSLEPHWRSLERANAMHSAPANVKVTDAVASPDEFDPHNQLVEQRLVELAQQRREVVMRLESLGNEEPELLVISRSIEQLVHSLAILEEARNTVRRELDEPLQLQLIQRSAPPETRQ